MRYPAVLIAITALAAGATGAGPTTAGPASADAAGTFRAVPLHGVAEPARRAVISAPVEDILTSIAVEEGQRVAAGDPLATIDDRVTRAAYEAARVRAEAMGGVLGAEAEVETATRQLDRIREMMDAGASGVTELEDAELRLKRAEAALLTARELKQQAEHDAKLHWERLERCQIRAPFDGVVARVEAEAGELVRIEDPVLVLVSVEMLRVEFHLPVSMYRGLQLGDEATLHASAPVGRPIRGTLAMIEPIIDPATRTFRCVFEVDNASGMMPAGFTATIDDADIAAFNDAASGPVRIASPTP